MASLINCETAEGVVVTVHLPPQDAERVANVERIEVSPSDEVGAVIARVRIEVAPTVVSYSDE